MSLEADPARAVEARQKTLIATARVEAGSLRCQNLLRLGATQRIAIRDLASRLTQTAVILAEQIWFQAVRLCAYSGKRPYQPTVSVMGWQIYATEYKAHKPTPFIF